LQPLVVFLLQKFTTTQAVADNGITWVEQLTL
jgi:hypothetical protein